MKVALQRNIGKFKVGDTVDVSPFIAEYLKNQVKEKKSKTKKSIKASK